MSAINPVAFNPTRFLDDVARYIIAQHRAQLPRLADITILVPPRAAPALRDALARAAHAHAVDTLMLPRITTLRAWAAATPVARARVTPEAERVLGVYAALKKQRWFSNNETLALSHELVRLADELTDQLVTLPHSLDEHARILKRAYGVAKQNTHFSFEAELTYDVWRTLAEASEEALDAATLYGLQLAKLAANANAALYVVDDAGYAKREQAFFANYANSAPVAVFQASLATPSNARERFLATGFRLAPGGAAFGECPLAPADCADLHVYPARDVEDETGAALNTIKHWLALGKSRIAVVALDRQAARRLRALAERDQILMADEIGWPVSTTLSATAVMRLLEAKRDGFYYQSLMDLLKSPFIFSDWRETWGKPRLSRAVMLIESVIGRAGVVAGLLRVREALTRAADGSREAAGLDDALAIMDRLIDVDRSFASTRRTAQDWLHALAAALDRLGLSAGLAGDAAGVGLLQLLNDASQNVTASAIKLSMLEWTDWLKTLFEEARFRDAAVDSPIVMTSLDATRYRDFDGVILLGAAEGNLPGKPISTGVFNQSVRHALGLATHAARLPEITQDLVGLFSRSPQVWMSWQAHSTREPQLASPWLSALLLAAERAGASLLTAWPESPLTTGSSAIFNAAIVPNPAPVLGFEQVPRKISASGYQQLVDCPYRYFAQSVLMLREADEVVEEMEKRDFGELVHMILNRFHRKVARVSEGVREDMRAALLAETQAVFADALAQNFIAHGWRLQWESAIDAYLDWQIAREGGRTGARDGASARDGTSAGNGTSADDGTSTGNGTSEDWQWQAGELAGAIDLPLENDQTIRLEGRLDRLDRHRDDRQSSVIDYKARAVTVLKAGLAQPGEDVQLGVYAALAEAAHPERVVAEAAYLAIARDEVQTVAHPIPRQAGEASVVRLQEIFLALYDGAPLRAQGAEKICGRCAVRGLCRKDYWPTNLPSNLPTKVPEHE